MNSKLRAKKQVVVRPWFVAIIMVLAAFTGWLFWPRESESEISAIDLSRADGKPRFYATTYSKIVPATNITLRNRLFFMWMDYKRRHGKHNPAAYTFPASPVRPCSIHGMLN